MPISETTPPVIPGCRYVRRLGEGGQADVFEYAQELPSRHVAVKVLKSAVGAELRAQIVTEANVMAGLEHPFIVSVYSAGVTGDGRPYLVMQYYPGTSLANRLQSGPFHVSEVIRLGIQIGGAVATAHAAGILHRDIKPHNILLNARGTPGLSDFGISSHVAHAGPTESVSLPWAPPEALDPDGQATVASDVYSLGATLWHLLAGHSPFVGPGVRLTTAELMSRIVHMPAPATGRPDVPRSLEALLASTMAKDPRSRPPTMHDLVRALGGIERELRLYPTEAFMPSAPISGSQQERAAVAANLTADADTMLAVGPPISATPTRTRRPWLAIAVAAGAVVTVGALAVTWAVTSVSSLTAAPSLQPTTAPLAETAAPATVTITPTAIVTTTIAPIPAPVTVTVPPAAQPPAQTITYPDVVVPVGSKECFRDPSGGPWAAAGTANPTTSCGLSINTRAAYLRSGINGGTGTVTAYSEVNKKEYLMTCSGTQPVLCTGGIRGRVVLYGGRLVRQ